LWLWKTRLPLRPQRGSFFKIFGFPCCFLFMFNSYPQALKIKEQEYLLNQLDRGEIDNYEFIVQLLNLRRHEPEIIITKKEIEKNFDFIPLFRSMVDVANCMISYQEESLAKDKGGNKRE